MNEDRKAQLKGEHNGHDCARCSEAIELIDETINLKRISAAWRDYATALTKCSGAECAADCEDCAEIDIRRKILKRMGETS